MYSTAILLTSMILVTLWYLGTLLPVIGLVPLGPFSMADRYTYVPLIGLFIMLAWGSNDLFARWRFSPLVLTMFLVVITVILAALSCLQVRHWRNSLTLSSRAVAMTSNNSLVHANLGQALAQRGKPLEGIDHFQKALRIAPDDPSIHNGLAILLANQGKTTEAMHHFSEAVKHAPEFADPHLYLGILLDQQGDLPRATAHFFEAVRWDPENAEAHDHLGVALAEQGRLDEAISHFSEAVRLKPDNASARANLGLAMARKKARN